MAVPLTGTSFLGTYNGYDISKSTDTGSTLYWINVRKTGEEGYGQPANMAGPYSSSNIASTKIDALILRRLRGSTN